MLVLFIPVLLLKPGKVSVQSNIIAVTLTRPSSNRESLFRKDVGVVLVVSERIVVRGQWAKARHYDGRYQLRAT